MFIILCTRHHTWHTVGAQHVLHEQMQECVNKGLCVKYSCFPFTALLGIKEHGRVLFLSHRELSVSKEEKDTTANKTGGTSLAL